MNYMKNLTAFSDRKIFLFRMGIAFMIGLLNTRLEEQPKSVKFSDLDFNIILLILGKYKYICAQSNNSCFSKNKKRTN